MIIDPRDDTWRLVEAYCHGEIIKLREELTSTGLDESETLGIRFEIKRLRDLLELPEKINHGKIAIDPDDYPRS